MFTFTFTFTLNVALQYIVYILLSWGRCV